MDDAGDHRGALGGRDGQGVFGPVQVHGGQRDAGLCSERFHRGRSIAVTHEQSSEGVPIIVAGDTEDKPEVASRIAWSGVGVNLRTGVPSPEAVRSAVQHGWRPRSHSTTH